MSAPFVETARSNFKHKFSFVIQAWDSSLGKWLDTKYGNVNLPACQIYTVPEILKPSHWMGGRVGKIRIVHSKK